MWVLTDTLGHVKNFDLDLDAKQGFEAKSRKKI